MRATASAIFIFDKRKYLNIHLHIHNNYVWCPRNTSFQIEKTYIRLKKKEGLTSRDRPGTQRRVARCRGSGRSTLGTAGGTCLPRTGTANPRPRPLRPISAHTGHKHAGLGLQQRFCIVQTENEIGKVVQSKCIYRAIVRVQNYYYCCWYG